MAIGDDCHGVEAGRVAAVGCLYLSTLYPTQHVIHITERGIAAACHHMLAPLGAEAHHAHASIILQHKGQPYELLRSIGIVAQGHVQHIASHIGKGGLALLHLGIGHGRPALGVEHCQIDITAVAHIDGQGDIATLGVMTGDVTHEDIAEEAGNKLLAAVQPLQVKVLRIGEAVGLGHLLIGLVLLAWLGADAGEGHFAPFVGEHHIP